MDKEGAGDGEAGTDDADAWFGEGEHGGGCAVPWKNRVEKLILWQLYVSNLCRRVQIHTARSLNMRRKSFGRLTSKIDDVDVDHCSLDVSDNAHGNISVEMDQPSPMSAFESKNETQTSGDRVKPTHSLTQTLHTVQSSSAFQAQASK